MVFFVQSFGALPENRVCIGECVNRAVQANAFLDVGGVMGEIFAAYAIGHEIPDLDKIVVAGKVDVREEIHGRLRIKNFKLKIGCNQR